MTQRTRISACALAVDDGRILLCRIAPGYPGTGMWTLPGGGLDWGEDPETGMERELYEETGLTGSVRGLIGIDSFVYEETLHAIRIVYDVDVSGEPRVTEIDGSVDRSRWVPFDELPELSLVSLVRYALEAGGVR